MDVKTLCKSLNIANSGGNISSRGRSTLIDIMSSILSDECNWVYRFTGSLNGVNLIVSFDMESFDVNYKQSGERFINVLDNIEYMKIIPHDGYMSIEMMIPNFVEPIDFDTM